MTTLCFGVYIVDKSLTKYQGVSEEDQIIHIWLFECLSWRSRREGMYSNAYVTAGVQLHSAHLKVHKREKFFGFDFEFFTIL
jgi:hypothetical protein